MIRNAISQFMSYVIIVLVLGGWWVSVDGDFGRMVEQAGGFFKAVASAGASIFTAANGLF